MEKSKSSNTVLIVILVLCVLGLVGYIGYDKFMNNNEASKVNTISKHPKDGTNTGEIDNGTQLLNSNIGEFLVTSDGNVYYNPKNIGSIDVVKASKDFFINESDYKVYCQFQVPTECSAKYKLDVNNIVTAYAVSTSNAYLESEDIVMIRKDGKISVFSTNIESSSKAVVKLTKEMPEYNNIVSAVLMPTLGAADHLDVIDSSGNKYLYNPILK